MADWSALRDLLARAQKVFELAGQLGSAFMEERRAQRVYSADLTAWDGHALTFKLFSEGVLALRDATERPPDGFQKVSGQLREAARIAKGIRDSLQTAAAEGYPGYLDLFPELNSLAQNGWYAVKEASKSHQLDDPLADLADLAGGDQRRVDTTPASSKVPRRRIPILGEEGRYLASFNEDEGRWVWESRGFYTGDDLGSTIEWEYSLFRVHRLRRGWKRYVRCKTNLTYGGGPLGAFVSAVKAVEWLCAMHRMPGEELLRDADADREVESFFEDDDVPAIEASAAEPKFQKSNILVVFDERTRQDIRLDLSGEHWGPVERPHDWDGIECYWRWLDTESLYRQGNRFVLLIETDHMAEPLPTQTSCRVLLDPEAADWFTRNGILPPGDLAHLTTIRAAEDVTDEELEAARQREATNQLGTEEELELLFPSGCASNAQSAANQAEPPIQPVTTDGRANSRTRKGRLPPDEELNLKVREILLSNPKAGCRRIGRAIGCSANKVRTLPAYIAVEEKRKAMRVRAPAAESFTDEYTESFSEGEPHKVLNDLIDEQAADKRDDEAPRRFMGKPIGRRRKA